MEVEDQSIKQYVSEKLIELFDENIPVDSVKQLPPFYKYSFGAALLAILFGTFLYFVQHGTVTIKQMRFDLIRVTNSFV